MPLPLPDGYRHLSHAADLDFTTLQALGVDWVFLPPALRRLLPALQERGELDRFLARILDGPPTPALK